MITITPNYYKKFKCIADQCKHSCCIGWEIEIDENTLEKYKKVDGVFSENLKSNIEFGEPSHFKLDEKERCPFLNGKGLCDIIINLGEENLCQICSDHPRFRNYYNDFVEVGLGLCCEAAAELVLSCEEKTVLNLPSEALQNPLVSFREKILNLLQDRTKSIDNRVDEMLKIVGRQIPTETNWYAVFDSLEKLDNSWSNYLLRIKNGIFASTIDDSLETAYEQLIVYLVYRHFLDCQYDEMVQERILFVALIYNVIKTMNISKTLEELLEIVRIFSCEIEYSDENVSALLFELR